MERFSLITTDFFIAIRALHNIILVDDDHESQCQLKGPEMIMSKVISSHK